jgi:two-component system, cell cycle sensor histidine kinase and response regulator CckA
MSSCSPPATRRSRDHGRQGTTILVVEDEASLLLPLSRTLRREGFTVLEASDGSAAVDLIRTHKDHVDVLLLDIGLPGVPSRKVFEETRLLRPDATVIVTSAYSKEKAAASLAAPVEHFIRKPYRLTDLLNLIQDVLSSHGSDRYGGHSPPPAQHRAYGSLYDGRRASASARLQ